MEKAKPFLKLQTKITLLVCGVVALALLATDILISNKMAENMQNSLADNATNIARIVAHSSTVVGGLTGTRDEADIQKFCEETRKAVKVEYIVVMDMHGVRKSHPDVTKIGHHFVGGDEAAALKGQEYTSIAVGTLGTALRAFTPVLAPDGRQVGVVAVGIMLNYVHKVVDQSTFIILRAIGFGLFVGILGAILMARNIKKTLFGLEPNAIAKLVEERNAMLHSVREGIIAVDKRSRITMINEAAARILAKSGITNALVGKDVDEVIPNTRLKDVLQSGQAEFDQEQNLNGITLLTNRVPLLVEGKILGVIATFRDKTEIRRLAEQLTGVRNYAEALRAQTHEFMNKMHVILGLVHVRNYEQLEVFINGIARHYQAEVGFVIRCIKDPVMAGFMLGKMSHAREQGIEFILEEDSFLPEPVHSEISQEMITIIGNLIDNALEAVQTSARKTVCVSFSYSDTTLQIEVSDTGVGIAEEQKEQIFNKGYSTKDSDRGLGLFLLRNSLKRLGGDICCFSEIGKGTCFVVDMPYASKGVDND